MMPVEFRLSYDARAFHSGACSTLHCGDGLLTLGRSPDVRPNLRETCQTVLQEKWLGGMQGQMAASI